MMKWKKHIKQKNRKITTSPFPTPSGTPLRRLARLAPLKAFSALDIKALEAPPLSKTQVLGPIMGKGAMDLTNLEQNAKLACEKLQFRL